MSFDNKSLQNLIMGALERIAFLVVEPTDPNVTNDLPPAYASAKIDFDGFAMGTVVVSASEGFLLEMASGILGVEPEDISVEVEGLDALREITNILGGEVLRALGGDDNPSKLSLPEVINSAPSTWPTASCLMDAMGELLYVSWYSKAAKKAA